MERQKVGQVFNLSASMGNGKGGLGWSWSQIRPWLDVLKACRQVANLSYNLEPDLEPDAAKCGVVANVIAVQKCRATDKGSDGYGIGNIVG